MALLEKEMQLRYKSNKAARLKCNKFCCYSREATRVMKKNIKAYNEVRPHAGIDFLTPAQAHGLEGKIPKRWKKSDWKNRKKCKKEIVLEDYHEFNGAKGF